MLRQVKTFAQWEEMAFAAGNEDPPAFGVQLRRRVSSIVETAALANGAFDRRVYTHSLSAG